MRELAVFPFAFLDIRSVLSELGYNRLSVSIMAEVPAHVAVFFVAEYLLDFLVERSIEVRNHIVPLQVAVCNLVEIFLDIGSKVISHDAVEILYQVVSDDHSDFLWKEPAFFRADGFSLGSLCDDASFH